MKIEVGDKVYHKSNSNIVWVVDKIETEEAHCSTIIKDTYEKKEVKFAISSLAKINDESIGDTIIFRSRNNHF